MEKNEDAASPWPLQACLRNDSAHQAVTGVDEWPGRRGPAVHALGYN